MNLFEQWGADHGTFPPEGPSMGGGLLPYGGRAFKDDAASADTIFSLKRTDWAAAGSRGVYRGGMSRLIKHIVIENAKMVMATSDCYVIRWNLDDALEPEEIEISRRTEDKINKLFLDPTGNHLVVGMDNGDNFYLHSSFVKAKKLPKWQGVMIESIAFDKYYGSEASTKSILVGTNRGQFFETSLEPGKERPFTKVHELEQNVQVLLPIKCLEFELLNSPSDEDLKIFVLAATANPIRLYKFSGGPTFEELFRKHRESGSINVNFLEFGSTGSFRNVDLRLFSRPLETRAQSLAMLTETGIYQGKLALSPVPSSRDNTVVEAELLDYMDYDHKPISLALTEFHFILLFDFKWQVISKLNGKIVQEGLLDRSLGSMRGLIRDAAKNTFWLYSDKNLFQVMVKNEDRHVWRLYLDKALAGDDRKFDIAYQYCKDATARAQVHSAQANFYFEKKQYDLAAKYYGKTSYSFEAVALKFVGDNQENALKMYLLEKLASIPKENKTPRCMICTWLTEIFLKQLVYLDPSLNNNEYEEVIKEFRAFLTNCYKDSHPPTSFQLLGSHGRREEILLFATLIEDDLDRVVSYHIQEKKFATALHVLNQSPVERVEQLFYKYSYLLMEHEPEKTVQVWMSKPQLNPTKLIPSLVRYVQKDPRRMDLTLAIKYLDHCITKKYTQDSAIYNYLLQLYASLRDDTDLLKFLNLATTTREGQKYLDLRYALRICTQFGKIRACVLIYSVMGLYEDAVELALKVDVALAKENAQKPDCEEIRKRLWLMVARHLIDEKKANVKEAIALLDECDLLKIEDILGFFPDFVVIDDFKPEICKSLQEYSDKIKSLKAEMEEYTESSTEIEAKLGDLKSRSIYVSSGQTCELCGLNLLTHQFYVFPCTHAFHGDCLLTHVLPHLNETQKRAVNGLQERLSAEAGNQFPMSLSKRKALQLANLQADLDGYFAAECPFCGNVMVQSIDSPLITEEEAEEIVPGWDIYPHRLSGRRISGEYQMPASIELVPYRSCSIDKLNQHALKQDKSRQYMRHLSQSRSSVTPSPP